MNLLKFLLLIVLTSSIQYSNAQLVNIEEKRKEKKEGFQGETSVSLKITQNTKKIIQGNNEIALQYSKKANTILFFNDITLMKVKEDEKEDDDLVNENFQHFRYNYTFKDSSFLTSEFFIQRQQNKVKYIELRALIGTGFRFRILNNEYVNFYLAPLIMYENEILNDNEKTKTQMIKGDLYTSLNLNISNNVQFSNITYYQPALYDLANYQYFEYFNDYRIASETSLNFTIIEEKLNYLINFEMSYDSRPPEELINNNFFYTFSNKINFIF